MQRLHRLLRAKVASTGTQVEIIQMPDHRWPRVVQHPLNHSRGCVLVPAVRFEHGANSLVSHELGFEGVVFDSGRVAIARIQSIREYVDIFKFAATRVVVPPIVDRPQMIFRQHFAHALDRRHRRPRTGLGIESISSAASAGIATMRQRSLGVGQPIRRRNVFVRTGHLDAAVAGHRSRLTGCRRHHWIGPARLLFDIQINLFNVRRRRVIAAIQPHRQAGMVAQPVHLIAQRCFRNRKIFRFPFRPMLPEIAAAPACHEQDSLAVGKIEKFLSLQLAFQTNRVQAHVLHVTEFIFQSLRIFTEHHVWRPASTTNQNLLPVDRKHTLVVRTYFRTNLTNAEVSFCPVGSFPVHIKFHI